MDKNAENEDEQIPDTGVSKAAFQENDHRFAVIGMDLCSDHRACKSLH